jgi:hypothetical protein
MTWPTKPYGDWRELGLIEVGQRAEDTYDELFSIEKRLCSANGVPVEAVRRQMSWIRAKTCQ